MELFQQHDLDGPAENRVRAMAKVCEIETTLEFIAEINEHKDCLMAQDSTQEDPKCLWFNIDVCKGHGLNAGDRVRVTVEKI
jgi:hypothetical protein